MVSQSFDVCVVHCLRRWNWSSDLWDVCVCDCVHVCVRACVCVCVVLINPLITNDAYMRQIIACAEVPMTHICVKDEGAHFHGIFGSCERATALSSSQPIQ